MVASDVISARRAPRTFARRASRALPGRRPVLLLLLLLVAVAGPAGAASEAAIAARQEGIWRYLAATDLARALGAPVESADGVLTLRSRFGVLTAFARSPDALWTGAGAVGALEFSAASPVLVVDGAWYLPEDMVGVLGVTVGDDVVTLPGGQVRRLAVSRPRPLADTGSSEVLELGPGVQALRLYAASPAGPDTVSLLAVDLGLLALAFPEQRVALDAQVRELHADKTLFLVVTSLAPAAWDPAIYVVQDGVEVLLRSPLAVQVLEGDPAALTPASPVAAVAFLPSSFDLRRPMQIRWAGASGSLTLRR
jgi:hypothetical protein